MGTTVQAGLHEDGRCAGPAHLSGRVEEDQAMFWFGLVACLFVAVILSVIGRVLIQLLGDRFPAARFFGYLVIGLGALLVLSSPFIIATRYETS